MQTPTMVQYATAPKSNRGSRLGRGSDSTSTMEQYGYSQPAANITVSPSFSNIGNPNVSVGNIGEGGSPSVTPPPVTPPPVTPPPVTPPPVTPSHYLNARKVGLFQGLQERKPHRKPRSAASLKVKAAEVARAVISTRATKTPPAAPPAAPAQAKAKAKAKVSSFSTRMPKATSRAAKKK